MLCLKKSIHLIFDSFLKQWLIEIFLARKIAKKLDANDCSLPIPLFNTVVTLPCEMHKS